MKHLIALIAALCLATPFAPAQTVTSEVDLTDALGPLREADTETNRRIDALEARVEALEEGETPPPDNGNGSTPDPTPDSAYGIGLEPVTSYSTAWPFRNLALLMKWREGVGGYVIYEKGHPPAGDYLATWEGSGTVTFDGGFTVTDRAPNRVALRVQPDAGILIVRPDGDVDGLKITPKDWDGSPFHPLYIDRLRPFRVLRFMDWQRTNNAGPRTWTTRVTPGDNQGTDAGVALEYMVEICNELKADPWLCMPHRSEPHYVRSVAEYLRDHLHEDATVYVEWSNEVWNDQFDQGAWLAERSGSPRRSDAWFERWASEARQDFDAFRDVLGSGRVVRVLGVHLQNPWIAQKLTAHMPAGSFDALAPSAYFGFRRQQSENMPSDITADALADILQRNIAADNAHWYGQHALIAQAHRVDLIAYEGGTHAQPIGVRLPYNAALRELNYSPRMIGLYDQNLRAFRDAGGGLIAAYHFTGGWDDQWGGFGHLEYQDQPIDDAPRYQAITEPRNQP